LFQTTEAQTAKSKSAAQTDARYLTADTYRVEALELYRLCKLSSIANFLVAKQCYFGIGQTKNIETAARKTDVILHDIVVVAQ
jgi:hypothetical protein